MENLKTIAKFNIFETEDEIIFNYYDEFGILKRSKHFKKDEFDDMINEEEINQKILEERTKQKTLEEQLKQKQEETKQKQEETKQLTI